MENVLAGTRMAEAVRGALAEYLEDELVNRIMEEIAERYRNGHAAPSYSELVDLKRSASHQ